MERHRDSHSRWDAVRTLPNSLSQGLKQRWPSSSMKECITSYRIRPLKLDKAVQGWWPRTFEIREAALKMLANPIARDAPDSEKSSCQKRCTYLLNAAYVDDILVMMRCKTRTW